MTEFLHRFRALSYRRAWLRRAVFAGVFAVASNAANAASQEVVFRVGDNSAIDWFVIDNPAIHGTINVTNAPYAANAGLNGAAVDLSRNRLVYDDEQAGQGYAIDLAGLQLIQNGVTAVTVATLGAWPNAGPGAGYRKADSQVYYYAVGSDKLRQLNFDSNKLISGSTVIGSLNGSNAPNAITQGDLDFGSNGSIWLTGFDAGNAMLWNFDFATLNTISAINLANVYRGITFNATGDTLYGYVSATGQYGVVNTATGAFQTILDTDTTLFGSTGDLATGTVNITIVPEPGSLSLLAVIFLPFLSRRFRHA